MMGSVGRTTSYTVCVSDPRFITSSDYSALFIASPLLLLWPLSIADGDKGVTKLFMGPELGTWWVKLRKMAMGFHKRKVT